MSYSFGIVGGDRRQAVLAADLARRGHRVCTYGLGAWSDWEAPLERAMEMEVVVLPLPLCRNGEYLNCEGETISLSALFDGLKPGTLVLAGQVAPEQQRLAEARGLRLVDYFRREEMTVANAAATAEGAIQVAMQNLERTLLGANCLVLGFGRIGKLLAHRLWGLGSNIAVTARKPSDLAWIDAYGWQAIKTNCLDGALADFHVVFNTIPSLILQESLLRQLPPNCLCIDLASVPGIDQQAAESCGIRCIWARGLPGKLVPESAAAAIGRAVDSILEEWREPD